MAFAVTVYVAASYVREIVREGQGVTGSYKEALLSRIKGRNFTAEARRVAGGEKQGTSLAVRPARKGCQKGLSGVGRSRIQTAVTFEEIVFRMAGIGEKDVERNLGNALEVPPSSCARLRQKRDFI